MSAEAKGKGKATDPIDVDSKDVEVIDKPTERTPVRQPVQDPSAMDVDTPRGRPPHRQTDSGPRTRSASRGELPVAGTSAPNQRTKCKSETPAPSSKKPRVEDDVDVDNEDDDNVMHVPPEPGFPPEKISPTWMQHVSACACSGTPWALTQLPAAVPLFDVQAWRMLLSPHLGSGLQRLSAQAQQVQLEHGYSPDAQGGKWLSRLAIQQAASRSGEVSSPGTAAREVPDAGEGTGADLVHPGGCGC